MNFNNNNININYSNKDNPNRRIELLQIARKTRIRWVFEGKDRKDALTSSIDIDSVNINESNTHENSIVNRNSSTNKVPIQLSDEIKYRIPASECIQNVINFLNEMVDDDEIYDINTLITDSLEYNDDDALEDIISSDDIDNNLIRDNNSMKTTVMNNSNFLYAIKYPYLYNQFVSKLILPHAIDITKSIQQFVFKFFKEYDQSKTKLNLTIEQSLFDITTNDDDNTSNSNNLINSITIADIDEEYLNWSNQIWLFLDHIYEQMQGCIIWNNETIEDFEKTKIYCEKFLFKKLHTLLYAVDGNDDMMHEKTKERIHSLSFLTAEHLDIKCLKLLYQQYYYRKHNRISSTSNQSIDLSVIEYTEDIEFLQQLLDIPMKYLLDMNNYYCPQDKLQCIRNCTKAIAQILKDSRPNTSLPGADELLPMMIYTIKMCNPDYLHSNLKYLQRFLRSSQLIAEAGYLLTNFVSAVYFLNNVDAKALTIEPDEFDRAIQRSKHKAKNMNDKRYSIYKNHSLKSNNTMKSMEEKDSIMINNNCSSNNDSIKSDLDTEKLLIDYKKSINVVNKKEFISIKDVYTRNHMK